MRVEKAGGEVSQEIATPLDLKKINQAWKQMKICPQLKLFIF
jgi:hypothetical protein